MPTQAIPMILKIIDWILSFFAFYLVYRLVKRTRAFQLLMGVAFVFILYYIGDLLNLVIFRMIMQNVITALIVALPVVFQPELREVLGKLGSGKYYFRKYFAEGDEQKMEHVLVEALFSMAKNRVGALVVLERKIDLREFEQHGTIINADVSQELIETIFFPDTPLHDGAVIIRDGKIYAAGCVLPLSNNSSISRVLGTRHRAGLGISENTDAISLIASEEAGKVSLAYGGELKYDVTPEFMKGFLESNLGIGEVEQKFIPIPGIHLGNWFKKR